MQPPPSTTAAAALQSQLRPRGPAAPPLPWPSDHSVGCRSIYPNCTIGRPARPRYSNLWPQVSIGEKEDPEREQRQTHITLDQEVDAVTLRLRSSAAGRKEARPSLEAGRLAGGLSQGPSSNVLQTARSSQSRRVRVTPCTVLAP